MELDAERDHTLSLLGIREAAEVAHRSTVLMA
jgi:hypothetical protein